MDVQVSQKIPFAHVRVTKEGGTVLPEWAFAVISLDCLPMFLMPFCFMLDLNLIDLLVQRLEYRDRQPLRPLGRLDSVPLLPGLPGELRSVQEDEVVALVDQIEIANPW